MDHAEMASRVSRLVGDDRFDGLVPEYLETAKAAIVARRWPYDQSKTWDDVPEAYHALACDIAAYLVNRRGSEGETSHSESGTSRSYESAGIPDTYLRCIVPMAGTV